MISTNGAVASTELYRPATNSFAPSNQTASMKYARDFATATMITTGPNAGKLLIAGGLGYGFVILASTDLYDPVTNTFAPANQTASMNAARREATATAITTGPNAGKILIAGGEGSLGVLDSTELYDPVTNTFAPFSQTASMNSARRNATATTITTGPNAGKILIVGGAGTSTELYDPTTNSFAPPDQTASMNTGDDSQTATTITTGPNAGKILIAGGGGGNFNRALRPHNQ